MDALGRSDALMQRSDMLIARSARIRAAADEKLEKSERLIAAAQKALRRARDWGAVRAQEESHRS